MEVKCLAPGQRTGQCLFPSMTSPVFVTIKSLNFHNLSASLCHTEKPASVHTPAEKTIFPAEHETSRGEKRTVVIPANPSVTARDEG